MSSLYTLPDGRHIAVGEPAGIRDLDTVEARVGQFQTAVVLASGTLGEHHATVEKQLASEHRLIDALKAELDRLRALRNLECETWTPSGGAERRTYDLTISYRDANGDPWTPIGWLAPFDGVPVPYLECRGRAADIETVINECGPLTADPES